MNEGGGTRPSQGGSAPLAADAPLVADTPLAADAPLVADATLAAEALARNDRYLREFVEALSMCPYAQRCRESGKLHRRVLTCVGGPAGSAGFDAAVADGAAAIAQVEALPEDAVEVALLLFPAFEPALARGAEGSRLFEHFCAAVRARMLARHAQGEAPFFCVAFHPDFPEDLQDEHRAVRFIRRSPDPTLQLVRVSVLRAVRGDTSGGSVFVDTTNLTAAELLALEAPLSVSDRIARADWLTLQREGPKVRALLESLKK